jgi:hypothetical protein
MPNEGEAFIGVHADTDPFDREIGPGVERAADKEDARFKEVGHDIGETIGKSAGKELEAQGPELGRSIERGLKRVKVRTKVTAELDKDNNVIRRWVSSVTDEIEEAVRDAGGPGGPINKAGAAFTDAIGSAFNVSGKSPLIAFLIPLVGAIVELVLGAIQAVGALAAVLTTLPALIVGVIGQVAVLMVAFNGVGTAIQGAFAAKNTRELNEALKGLTPSARGFVKQLLAARGYMAQIKELAQENFFKALGDTFKQINTALGARFVYAASILAQHLGLLFRNMGLFFASPTFRQFIDRLIPSVVRFLDKFGPSFVKFLEGVFALATAAIPFLDKMGDILGGNLYSLGVLFSDIANDPDFQRWLGDMAVTLGHTIELFGQVIKLAGTLVDSLNKAGGEDALTTLIEGLGRLSFLLSSPVGIKALEGLLHVAGLLTDAFLGLVFLIIGFLALLETVGEFFHNDFLPLLETIGEIAVIGFAIVVGTIGGFFDWLWHKITDFFIRAYDSIAWFWRKITGTIDATVARIKGAWDTVITTAKSIPGRILGAISNLGSMLYNAGRNAISSFISGIKSMFTSIGEAVSGAVGIVANHIPHSPAKTGPLSGKGDPFYGGQETMRRFAAGMTMEAPTLRAASSEATSNVTFGPNSIRVGFEGVVPTEAQAASTGSAVGRGILSQLAARNTRLAVRTL